MIDESPYTERAHRLAIAAHLQRRDLGGVERAVGNVRTMLAGLGIDAEPSTKMLMRQGCVPSRPCCDVVTDIPDQGECVHASISPGSRALRSVSGACSRSARRAVRVIANQ